jgi:hypothetical protein
MRISKGIRLSIFSSSEFVIVILCRGLIHQAHLIHLFILKLIQPSYKAVKARKYTEEQKNQQ